ncbi:MAG TPA: hypothetical protein VHY84_12295 [Bryobacteraceae bacterium]|jgi:antitoxin MazE|nr:hypothetical protein [Bryobacteraceae bacterium]
MIAKARIVQMGHSLVIRAPEGLLEHAQLPDEIEIEAEKGRMIVRPAGKPRAGWAEAARVMHGAGDDKLLC